MESIDSVTEKSQENKTMEILKTWALENSLIPELPDRILKLFLESCFYNLEQTKHTMVSYYNLRITSPEFFSNRNPSANELVVATTNGYTLILPGETKDGYKAILCGYWHTDSSTFVYNDITKWCLMTIDLWLSSIQSCPGLIVMIDCKNSCFGQITKTPMESVKKVITYFQEALPVQLQAVYFINMSTAMNFFLSLIQPFLSKRITSLIHKFVKGNEDYMNTIPKEMLPLEVGGEAGTIRELNDNHIQYLIDHTEWFREDDERIQLLSKKNRRLKNTKPTDNLD